MNTYKITILDNVGQLHAELVSSSLFPNTGNHFNMYNGASGQVVKIELILDAIADYTEDHTNTSHI